MKLQLGEILTTLGTLSFGFFSAFVLQFMQFSFLGLSCVLVTLQIYKIYKTIKIKK